MSALREELSRLSTEAMSRISAEEEQRQNEDAGTRVNLILEGLPDQMREAAKAGRKSLQVYTADLCGLPEAVKDPVFRDLYEWAKAQGLNPLTIPDFDDDSGWKGTHLEFSWE